jgi:esterase/lipase
MISEKPNPISNPIDLPADSDNEFFLIHGYTGSPTDFNFLPKRLHETFKATVKIPRLIGHGTKIQDLDNLEYKDFMSQIEQELQKELAKGKNIILGGISFGAVVALILASRYPVKAVFNICPPFLLKPKFRIPGVGIIGKFKKYWKKDVYEDEVEKRKNSFNYAFMHSNGLKIIKQANKELKQNLNKITCPILTLHTCTDSLASDKSLDIIHSKVNSQIKKGKVMSTKVHNLFFSVTDNETYNEIINFIKDIKIFELR